MIILNYGELIKESEEELVLLERKQIKGLPRRRVRFVRLLKSGECTTQAQAGERIGINRRQSEKLWRRYREKGVADLLAYPYKGRKPRITAQQVQSLQEELGKDKIQTLKEACAFVEQHDGEHFSVPGMHFIFKRFHIKKKTGRPTHHHRDAKGAEELKKNAPPKAGLWERVFFEDEMRAGTRTECKRRWTPCGHRPVCKVKLGYEFSYLYGAIAPQSGHLLALMLPEMTQECFALFMDYFKEQTTGLYGNLPVLLLADGAGSHQRAVVEQRGIAWQPLPTACPELNPVERFFEELRKELSNQIFESIDRVEDCLSSILKKYWDNPQTIIQLCNFPYIRST